ILFAQPIATDGTAVYGSLCSDGTVIRRSSAVGKSVGELVKPPFQEPLLGFLARQRESTLIGGARVRGAAEPAVEVGAGGMGEVIVGEVATRQDRLDEGEAGGRSVALGDRHRPGQLDDRRGVEL